MGGLSPDKKISVLRCSHTMPKAYKVTSDPFYINGSVTQTAVDAFTQVQISAPLDSLNREGLLIHAVYFTSATPDSVPAAQSRMDMQLTSVSQTGNVGANNANLIARREIATTGGAAEFSGPHVIDMVHNTDSYSADASLGIVATDDLFFALDSNNQTVVKNASFRAVCSRIELTASAYAALVTNELSA